MAVAACLALSGAASAQAEVAPLDRGLFDCHAATPENNVTPPPPVWQITGDAPPDGAALAAQRPRVQPCAGGQVAQPRPLRSAAPPVVQPPRGGALLSAPPLSVPVGAYAPYYYAGDGWYSPGTSYVGQSVYIQVGTPAIGANAHSLAQLALSEDGTNNRTVELGWNVDPALYAGNRQPHLFLYVNKDHYLTNGQPGGDCYNCQFVPLASAPYHLGQVINTTFNRGKPVNFSVVYQNGNWWVAFNGSYIGYARSTFWGGTFQGASWIQAFGEVYDPSGPNSQMGNGVVGSNPSALAINSPSLFSTPTSAVAVAGHPDPAANPSVSSTPNYTTGAYSSDGRTWHYGGT